MTVDPDTAAAHRSYGELDYSFCSLDCAELISGRVVEWVAADGAP